MAQMPYLAIHLLIPELDFIFFVNDLLHSSFLASGINFALIVNYYKYISYLNIYKIKTI